MGHGAAGADPSYQSIYIILFNITYIMKYWHLICVLSCFTNFFPSQDKSIEEQLSMGIRYFDLRIAHKPNDSSSELYFTHVIYTHLTVLVSLFNLSNNSGLRIYSMSLLHCFFILFHRKRFCLLPPGWTLTQRRLLSLLAAILRELMINAMNHLFYPWRSFLAQNCVPERSVSSLCSWVTW